MNGFFTSALDAFRPHRPVRGGVVFALVAAQLLFGLAVWTWQPSAVLPSPREVLAGLSRLWMDEGLGPELLRSMMTSAEAVLLAALLAIPLAWMTVLPGLRPSMSLLSKGRFLGLAGLSLVFTLLTGGGHALKLSLLTTGMGVFLLTGMVQVVQGISTERIEHARSLRFSAWRTVREVVVRGTLAEALELIRQNAAIGWTMVTMVEGLTRSEGGVGALLLNQTKHFHLAEVFAIQLCIFAVGLMQDALLAAARRALCPYADLKNEVVHVRS